MQFIETIYIISGLVALSACVPQLHQLMRSRDTADFSLQTWGMWTVTHVVSLLYFVSINNIILIYMGTAWVFFYAAMTYLIVHCRHIVPRLQAQPIVVEESDPLSSTDL